VSATLPPRCGCFYDECPEVTGALVVHVNLDDEVAIDPADRAELF